MHPRDKDYARVARRIEAALDRTPQTPDAVIATALEASADLLAITGSCWHHSDPASGLPVTCGALGTPPGSFEESLVYEFQRPDVSLFRELQGRRAPVAAISAETRGELAQSARFREMIEPCGTADELRVSLHDSFGIWSSLCVFSSRRMTKADLDFAAALAPSLTRAIRAASAAQLDEPAAAPAPDAGGPSVLLLDGADRVIAADATARARLARLPEFRDVQVPGVVAFLAAQIRFDRSGAPATVRTRTLDGEWFTLDASLLDEGSVAVVIQPSAPDAVLNAVLRSQGLSAREREVASLLIQGRSAKAIASTLVISPWTVQDHMKAIYEKTGVSDRYALAALAS